ncbi:MAG: HEAT repeat domain-containing protein [Planctomycetota bacterium]
MRYGIALVAFAVLGAAPARAGEADGSARTSALSLTVPGEADRFVVVLEPSRRKILAYRAGASGLRLVAARSYYWDLRLQETPKPKGAGFTQAEAEKMARAGLSREECGRPIGVREELLKAGGEEGGGARFVLLNAVGKRILLYRLDRDALYLVSVRCIREDARKAGDEFSSAVREDKVKSLVDQLGHRLTSVREAAAKSLATMDPPPAGALEALKKALADDKAGVREAAAEAIKRIEAARPEPAEAGEGPGKGEAPAKTGGEPEDR